MRENCLTASRLPDRCQTERTPDAGCGRPDARVSLWMGAPPLRVVTNGRCVRRSEVTPSASP